MAQNTLLEQLAKELKTGLRFVGGQIFDTLVLATSVVVKGLNVSADLVSDAQGNAGYIAEGVYYEAGQAIDGAVVVTDGIVEVGGRIVGQLINTSRFVTDEQYRNSEGIPWLREILEKNEQLIALQMKEHGPALGLVYKFATGEDMNLQETENAKEHLLQIAQTVPALAIFFIPGGDLLLGVLAKLLPWNQFPEVQSANG